MYFLSRVWAIVSSILVSIFVFLLFASAALVIPALSELWKVVRTETPVADSTPKASNHCRSLHKIEKKNLRDISKKDLLAHIEKGHDIWWRRIKASTLVAALTEANRTKSRGLTGRGLFINSSVVYGDVHLQGLQNEIPVAMDKVVVKGDLIIENSNMGFWNLDTITGFFGSAQNKFTELAIKCVRDVSIDYSRISGDVEIKSAHQATIYESKIGSSLDLGTVLPYHQRDDVPRFYMSNTSVSKTARLAICSTYQVTSISESTVDERMDVQTYVYKPEGRKPMEDSPISEVSGLTISDSSFKDRVNISGLQTSYLDLSQCTFSDLVDLSYARIDVGAQVSDVDFDNELSLYAARLPSKRSDQKNPGIAIDRTRIGALRLRWEQLTEQGDWQRPGKNWYETKVRNQLEEAQWDQIEHSVAAIDDSTSTVNQIKFYRHVLHALPSFSFWERFQFIGWGFGCQPLWLFAWIFGFIGLYASIYWRYETYLKGAPVSPSSKWARRRFGILFSLRTAWHTTFGPNNSRNTVLKVITASESLIIKILLVLLVNSLAHVWPLLNEIVKSFLPS
jgi:hypothetical protein